MEQIFKGNQSETENLIEHIEDAKSWLDRAKEYYAHANPINAEMVLNLAQAEVKYTWELSRRRHVSKQHKTIPARKFSYVVAAASVLLILSLVFGFQRDNINKYVAGAFKPVEESAPIGSGPSLTSAKVVPKTVKEVESSHTVQSEPDSSVEPVSHDPSIEEAANINSTSTAISASREQPDSETVRNTVRVRQVSQMITIDEEALTREASHSLRNGK